MTREMIIEQLERHRTEFAHDHGWNTRVLESLDAAIKVLKQEPCEDAISRQAVLDIDFKRIILTTAKPAETIEQKVKALPSVQLPQNIIRCKECIFYTNFQKGKPWNVLNKYCNRVVTTKTSPDDFCSFAQAKVGDAENESENDMEELDFIPPRRIVGKMISADVLDKIRSEIEAEKNAGGHTWYVGGLDFALSIINKYMAESEDE